MLLFAIVWVNYEVIIKCLVLQSITSSFSIEIEKEEDFLINAVINEKN